MKKKAVPKVRIDKRSIPTELEQLLNMSDTKVDTVVYDSEETDTINFDEDLELLDIEKLIIEELDSFKPVSRDLRIDDSSMPIAKNFFHFCMDEAFLNSPPYLEQAIIGIKLMAEYCPRSTCTDMEWFSDDGHEAHEHMSTLTKKVSLLNHGVCPKCGARKSELIASGELHFYNELAVVAGQRCVTGDTHVFTSSGIERIGEIGEGREYGFSRLNMPVFNGEKFEQTSDFYRGKPERLYKLKLDNGYCLRGTSDHPIWTLNSGFVQLGKIQKDEVVPVYVGQQVWGNYLPTIKSLTDAAKKSYDQKIASLSQKCNKLNLMYCNFKKGNSVPCTDLYKVLGLWVAEGYKNRISNTDPEVLSFIYSVLLKYINARYLRITDNEIKLVGYGATAFLAALLNYTVDDLVSVRSATKKIPSTILKAPKDYVVAFMQGMFEGDGTVYSKKNQNKGKHYCLEYTSLSRELVYDIYTVLINLGMLPRIIRSKTWATNGTEKQKEKNCWTLSLTGDFHKKFETEVNFMSSRKRALLNESCSFYEGEIRKLMPFKHENYSFLKAEFIDVCLEAQKQLNNLPQKMMGKYKIKAARYEGLCTLFGRGYNQDIGCRFDKLLKNPDICLTKDKLRFISTKFLEYKHSLSSDVIAKFEKFHKYTDDNVYLVRVARCSLTNRVEETFDFTLPETHRFITQGVLSHNSGKSALSTMISAYVLHLFLKCGKPTELFGIRSNEVLHGTFLALTLGQATQNLWQPFLGYINNSPWFKNYHILLRKYERKYGETILKLKDTFIEYRHRNLQLYPATPDKRVLRGRTRFLGVLDELGWFDSNRDSNKVKDNAHEVYKAMSNSLATARQSENRLVALGYDQFMLTGYMLNVSSPNNIRDKIMELYKQSIGSKKSLGLHKPTWKMNPHIPFDGPLIQEEYRKDPIGAERDFGAQPSLSSNPFISNHRLIQETVREGQKNWVKYRSKIDRVSKDEKYRSVEIQNIKRNDSVSVLAIDAGYSNNSFALACGSVHDGTPHIDALIEVISLPGIPISHTRIFSDVIMPIIEHRNVKILLADRWNSIKLLQDAKASFPGLDISAQYSLKYNDMYDLKTAIELGAFKIPHIAEPNIKNIMENLNIDEYPNCFDGKPVEHLLVQMATVVDIGKKTVDKGDGFTDDLWRASALCHWALVNPDYQEILAKVVEQSAIKQPPLAVVRKLGSYDKLTSSSGTRVFSGTSKFIGTKKTSR